MKAILHLLWLVFLLVLPGESLAASGGSVRVKGYTKKDGTYVAPHYRSAPDHSVANNWSTKGNVNPYTGQAGTKNVGGSAGVSTPLVSSPPASALPAYVPPAQVRPTEVKPSPSAPMAVRREEPAAATITEPPRVSIQNDDPILAYQKKGAADGFPEAQYAMGMRYLTGNGVSKDETRGVKLIEEAASHACERAMEKMRELRQKK